MDVSGEVADLMVKESIQITEESVKLLAAGAKDLTAFLMALAQDSKKLSGKTNMGRLLRDGKELKVFRVKESDLSDFKSFAKKNVLYAVIKDKRAGDGMVDLITNVDYVSQVNHFMESRGYAAPAKAKGDETPKKAAPRARPDSLSPQRGNGSNPSQNRTRKETASTPARTATGTTPTSDKPSVKGRLAAFKAVSEDMKKAARTPQRTKGTPPKTR